METYLPDIAFATIRSSEDRVCFVLINSEVIRQPLKSLDNHFCFDAILHNSCLDQALEHPFQWNRNK